MNSSEFQYRFGAYCLDATRREVVAISNGAVLDLKPRAFDTLLFFVKHPGELLDKGTLLKAIWPGAIVEENNLNQNISALRRALAQRDAATPYIVTVPRRGYQFVATVSTIAPDTRALQPARREDASETRDPSSDLLAQQLYEQGRALFSRPSESNLRTAISLFHESSIRNPGFAPAFSACASAHAVLAGMAFEFDAAIVRAEQDADTALSIDPRLAEARAVLGFAATCRCRWADADAHFESSLALDPDDPQTRCWRTACLTGAAGYMKQAFQEHLDTFRRSPGNPATLIILAFLHLQLGQDADALKCVDLAAGLGFAGVALPVPFIRAQVAQRRGRYEEAARCMHQVTVGVTRPAEAHELVNTVYAALAGCVRKNDAVAAVRESVFGSEVAALNPVRFARPLLMWAVALDDLDLAYNVVNAVAEDFRHTGIVRVSVGFLAQLWMPELSTFRRDHRFLPFVAALGLPAFWSRRGVPDFCESRDGVLVFS